MIKMKFLATFFFVVVFFIFFRIYQHNLLIRLNYEKQRVESEKEELKKNKNELLVKYFELKDQHRVKTVAQEKLGMHPLKLSQIVTFT